MSLRYQESGISLALPKYINGKKDDAHHDGKYSNVKREQEAANKLKEWEEEQATYQKQQVTLYRR